MTANQTGATMSHYTVMQRTPIHRALATYTTMESAEHKLTELRDLWPADTFNILRETVPAR